MDETLMHKTPQTDFEKLIWEKHINKLLAKDNRAMLVDIDKIKEDNEKVVSGYKQELAELKERMKKDQVGIVVLKNKRLKDSLDTVMSKMKKLRLTNDTLIGQLARLNNPDLFKDHVDERAG